MKKRCPKCKTKKELNSKNWFRNKSRKNGFEGWCKFCSSVWRNKWNKKHRGKCIEWRKNCESRRPEHYKKVKTIWRKQDQEKLSDRYILNLLTGFHPRKKFVFDRKDIIPEIIQLKRQQIIFHRLLKQLEEKINGIN